MLRKINSVLVIIAVCTSLFCAGCFVYSNFTDVENSKLIQELEG